MKHCSKLDRTIQNPLSGHSLITVLCDVFTGFIIMVLYIKLHVLESRIQSKELQEISISNACVKSCKISDVMTLMIFLLI